MDLVKFSKEYFDGKYKLLDCQKKLLKQIADAKKSRKRIIIIPTPRRGGWALFNNMLNAYNKKHDS